MKHIGLAAAILTVAPAVALAQAPTTAPPPPTASPQAAEPARTGEPRRTFDTPPAEWGPRAGDSEVTLSGTGSNNRRFTEGSFGLAGSYGFFVNDNVQLNLRQGFNFASFEGTTWTGTTRVGLSYNFNLGQFRPFLGGNVGMVYGRGVRDTGIIGPEAGLKYYVAPQTFVFLQTEYQYFFRRGSEITDNFRDGAFVHTVGLGMNF